MGLGSLKGLGRGLGTSKLTEPTKLPKARTLVAPHGPITPGALTVGPLTARGSLSDHKALGLDAILAHFFRPEGKALLHRLAADLSKAGVHLPTLRPRGGEQEYRALIEFARAKELPVDPHVLWRFERSAELSRGFPDLEAHRPKPALPQPKERFHQVLMLHAFDVLGSVMRPDEAHVFDAALAQLVVAALAEAADASGSISVARAEATLGPRAKNFLAAVEASMASVEGQAPPRRARGIELLNLSPGSSVLAKLGASKPAPTELAARMPVLSELAAQLGADFSGFELVAVQHLFPTTGVLFDAFAEAGVSPERSWVLGKNYSADPDVYLRMLGQGWNMVADNIKPGVSQEPGWIFDKIDALPEELRFHADAQIAPVYLRLKALFEGVDPATSDRRFLLLDEGGKLVKLLHHYFPAYAPLCVAVEQTDRGIQELEHVELACPVVNVARSEAKKRHESPMIGENVVSATLAAIRELHDELLPEPKTAAIIGYGAVGKATADALQRRGYEVEVYDVDPAKRAQAEADGCAVAESKTDLLSRAQLLVSATGKCTVSPEEYDLLPSGAILVNAASGNHELGADRLSELSSALHDQALAARSAKLGPFDVDLEALDERSVRPYEDGKDTLSSDGLWRSSFRGLDVVLGADLEDLALRHSIVRTPKGNELLLLRSGYVVNLSDDIPPEFIQLTRALLYAACAQATKAKSPGLVELDAGAQAFIVKRMEKHLAAARLSLSAPDFDRIGSSSA